MTDILLIDLGGVLVDIDPGRTILGLAHASGLEPGEVFSRLESTGAHLGIDTGELSPTGLREKICEALDRSIDHDVVVRAWASWVAPIPRTSDVIGRLAKRHPLYLLSNTDPVHMEEVRRFGASWLDLFDGLFLSYEHGVLKPDPAFFERALATFGLNPRDCVFLDDVKENVDAAAALGIRAHQVPPGGLTMGFLEEIEIP